MAQITQRGGHNLGKGHMALMCGHMKGHVDTCVDTGTHTDITAFPWGALAPAVGGPPRNRGLEEGQDLRAIIQSQP